MTDGPVQWVDEKELWDKERVMRGIVQEPEPEPEPQPEPAPAASSVPEQLEGSAHSLATQDAGNAGLQQSDEGMQVGNQLHQILGC